MHISSVVVIVWVMTVVVSTIPIMFEVIEIRTIRVACVIRLTSVREAASARVAGAVSSQVAIRVNIGVIKAHCVMIVEIDTTASKGGIIL